MDMPPFRDYASPPPHLAFSADFFKSLTIANAAELTFPTIAPVGSVRSAAFSDNVPSSASATVIVPSEVIPAYSDLQAVTADIEEAFREGKRSVLVEFTYMGNDYMYNYHFSKLELIRNCSNFFPAILACRRLLMHLHLPKFNLGPALKTFEDSLLTSKIKGFFVSEFPLYKLGCFLGESWLEEDVFNALLEFSYFYLAFHSPIFPKPPLPRSLLLPTSFLADATLAYGSQPRVYTPEIMAVRHRVSSLSADVVAMSLLTGNHFTAFIYRVGSSTIEYGDSMHNPPPLYMLPIIQWVFDGTGQPPIQRIEIGTIAQQGLGNGEGSCGIAAYNFMERAARARRGIKPWTGLCARTFRDAALEDLLRLHHLACEGAGSFSDWATCMSNTKPSLPNGMATGYNDFNVYSPLDTHPIARFQANTALTREIMLPQYPVLPAVSDLGAMPVPDYLSGALASSPTVPLLPAFELTTKSVSAPIPHKAMSSPIANVSPARKPGKRRNKSLDSIDITLVSPRPPLTKKSATVKHETSSDEGEVEFVEPSLPLKIEPIAIDFSPPREPSVKGKVIIDLVTPPSQVKHSLPLTVNLGNLDMTPEQKPLQKHQHLVEIDHIDLCSPEKPPILQERSVEPSPGLVKVNSFFDTLEDAQAAIYAREEKLGHSWRKGQSKTDQNGRLKKMTFRCNHYARHNPIHSVKIDPTDHREGKSVRTDCEARVNVNRDSGTGKWRVTLIVWNHNHPPAIPEGAPIRRRPTSAQQSLIAGLATNPSQKFSRGQLAAVLESQTGTSLEPRQITNIMNKSRLEARREIESLGGDIHAIIDSLQEKSSREHGWNWHLKLDTNGVATGLWWQSPLQGELCRRYSDVLINDNTYNTNSAQYPLNIGVGVDSHGSSRNLWYCFQAIEDQEHHSWVLRHHLASTGGVAPDAFMSDRSRALIASAAEVIPTSEHFYCIQHLEGNVDQNLRRVLPADDWQPFKNCFWDAYRAVSPEEFDAKWKLLTTRYPATQKYLDEELYPCRRQWAWAYTSHKFTCGIRTNGRVEVENRITKAIGGPKQSLKQLFDGLNERTNGQGVKELIQVRDSSRRQHPSSIETIFPGPLALLRQYAGPYAINVSYEQMKQSMFLDVEFLQRPEGIRDWHEYALRVSHDHGYSWEQGEEKHMINTFQNDKAHISTVFLLRLIRGRGLTVQHLVRVTHKGTGVLHIVALLQDENYVCDCCMGMNAGLPCRHYFAILSAMRTLKFHLGVVRARWLQDKNLDLSTIPAVEAREAEFRRPEANLPAAQPPVCVVSNPLEARRPAFSAAPSNESEPTVPPTQTIPARTVFHEANAALAPLINGVQTQEQLAELLDDLQELREARRQEAEREDFREPLIHNPKGRPRVQRLTSAIEGPPRGGGAPKGRGSGGRKCTICRQPGHDRRNCPDFPDYSGPAN